MNQPGGGNPPTPQGTGSSEASTKAHSVWLDRIPDEFTQPKFEIHQPEFYLEFSLLLALSVLLASIVAFHPMIRVKMESVSEIEAPKAFLLYSVAGTIVGKLVSQQPIVAFVIFGIGGLFRFRTDIGSAKDTGRLLLVTLSGLCCGLGFPALALVTITVVFILLYILEQNVTYRLRVDGLEGESIESAAKVTLGVAEGLGCRVLRSRVSPIKQQVELVFRANLHFQEQDFEEAWRRTAATKLSAVFNWEKN